MKSLSYEINQSNIIKKTKKGFRINLVKGIKIFLKKKKRNIVAKDTKIFLNVKNKSQLSIEKHIIKYGKIP